MSAISAGKATEVKAIQHRSPCNYKAKGSVGDKVRGEGKPKRAEKLKAQPPAEPKKWTKSRSVSLSLDSSVALKLSKRLT